MTLLFSAKTTLLKSVFKLYPAYTLCLSSCINDLKVGFDWIGFDLFKDSTPFICLMYAIPAIVNTSPFVSNFLVLVSIY